MKRASIFALIVLSWIATAALPASAQSQNTTNTLRFDEGASSPPAKIDSFGWMSGYWQGQGLGVDCEEIWSRPVGDRMFGIFALRKDDEVSFSEAMELVEEDGSVVLKVKHFTPEFVAWEAKDGYVSFHLVRLGENEAFFNGLTFRRHGDDKLSIYLVLHKGEAKNEMEFSFECQPL